MRQIKLTIAALFLATPFAANADLIGDTVTLGHFFPDDQTRNLVLDDVLVVDGGAPEFNYFNIYTADVTADGVMIDFSIWGGNSGTWTGAAFNGFRILGIDSARITGLEIVTNFAGWDDSRASFTDDSASFNWQGISVNGSSRFSVRFTLVPEPGTLALLGLGLLGLGLAKRRSA